MSGFKKISDFQVVDAWHYLKLGSKYVRDKERIVKSLQLIFANFGLKIIDFKSNNFDIIRRRYQHITLQILKNNKVKSRSKYHGLNSEKIFFSETEFPHICEKEVSKR